MHISASQESKFIGCPRKWWFSKNRPRKPAGKGAKESGEAHEIQENWLKHQIPPDPTTKAGAWALAELPYLPHPGNALVEMRFELEIGGINHLGFMDFVTTQGALPYAVQEQIQAWGCHYDPNRIVVGDHKFLKDLKYRKQVGHHEKDKNFEWDPQRIDYGAVICATTGAPDVAFVWNNVQKVADSQGGYPVVPTIMVESRASIEARFGALYQTVKLPIVYGQGQPAEAFERNLSHCGAFGGCDYKDECLADLPPAARLAERIHQQQRKNVAA